jgi:TATA-box binding protein (TBP) (component of TFIID and TFIIIB)
VMPSVKKLKRLQPLRIVNTVWKGEVGEPILLAALNILCGDGVRLVKHQKSQPEQYIVKFDNKSTMLIFKSGKFRLMGNGNPESAVNNILNVVNQISDTIPEVSMQTMTGVYGYGKKINLRKLAEASEGFLDLENFPAVQIKRFKPIHVNVFASGCVTLCGLKSIDNGNVIKNYLDPIVNSCLITS